MNTKVMLGSVGLAAAFAVAGCQPDASHDAGPRDPKYSLQVPNGLAFSEFEGYETWETVSVSHNGDKLAAIVGNPTLIAAYKSGIPGNGKPFPDGAKFAKIHYNTEVNDSEPGQPVVPTTQHDVDFMVKDAKRFPEGGWGYAAFDYDPASKTFKPGTTADSPPQANNATCGLACHTIVKTKDYVYTRYQTR